MTKAARFFSYLLHPALMPLLGVFIIFNSEIYTVDIPWEIKKYTYLIVALFSVLLPVSLLPVFMYWRIIRNFELSGRKERIYPIAVSAFSLIVLHVFISKIIHIKIITAFTFSVALISIILLLANLFFKISMHLMGIGGITGLIIALSIVFNINSFIWLAGAILLTGITSTSRLALKAHTWFEISAGYITGLVFMLAIIGIIMQ